MLVKLLFALFSVGILMAGGGNAAKFSNFRSQAAVIAQTQPKAERQSVRSVQTSIADHEKCSGKLRQFIKEMDAFLDENSPSLLPLLALLERHFPLANCDIDIAAAICAKSKYFYGVEEQVTRYVFTFSSAKYVR